VGLDCVLSSLHLLGTQLPLHADTLILCFVAPLAGMQNLLLTRNAHSDLETGDRLLQPHCRCQQQAYPPSPIECMHAA
jgi:hypothetical protein